MEQEEGHAEDRGGVAAPVVAPSPWDPASFDLLPVGVALWDADARLEHANPVLCDLLGAPLERLRRTDLLDVVLAEDRSTTAVAVAELLGGELQRRQRRLRGAARATNGASCPGRCAWTSRCSSARTVVPPA